MPRVIDSPVRTPQKSVLDRVLSLFTDIRAGEGATALLMLLNIFLLLVCYSVIKTVREPLILLGGGAEVRSYAAAGQALLLMGFVPLYGWLAARLDRAKLLIAVTMFFIAGIELFALAVAAGVPYVGVAFFIWVGIFNISLVAQFWSFATDVYSKEAGDRLFPIIVIGMTAGAPLGSFVAARLFASGIDPQTILHLSALLLAASVAIYLWINTREERRSAAPEPMLSLRGGFRLVMASRYLRLIALLVVLLNVVNSTGEYLVAKLLTSHVEGLALINPAMDKRAYIGAFSGDYQFWVNVVAFLLQAFVTSRLVKYRGLRGVLLALPLIALGGYAVVAAGVGFSVVRWVKTAENAADYSIMNTARQLLWLPTSREEKYKAKQAIDTFFVRIGDLLAAGVVLLGTQVLHLNVQQFAIGNIVLTLVWLATAVMILAPQRTLPRLALRPLVARAAAVVLMLLTVASPGFAQQTRQDELAEQQARKATALHPYQPTALERRIEKVEHALSILGKDGLYPFVGSAFDGGGFAFGPGYRARFGDTGSFDTHAAWSLRNYKTADAALTLPSFADRRVTVALAANRLEAPNVPFYGTGNDSLRTDRTGFAHSATTAGVSTRVQASSFFTVGGDVDFLMLQASGTGSPAMTAEPSYRRTGLVGEIDWRTSPSYTRRGGLYRIEWSDYRQTNGGAYDFRRTDVEVQQFVPVLRENWVIALRALASTTSTQSDSDVPYFLMPDLGGSHTLRGYPSWRFRDRNRLMFTGEYRWTAGPFVDMALFLDAGQVAARSEDFAWRDFKKTYGIGISLHTPTTTVTRIELARTPEGTSLVFSFGPSF